MTPGAYSQFLHFLHDDLAVPADSISFAQQYMGRFPELLPMTLWQHHLVTLDQLEQIFDWLEAN